MFSPGRLKASFLESSAKLATRSSRMLSIQPLAAVFWRGGDARKGRTSRASSTRIIIASLILLTPSMGSAQTASFQIEETTIEDIQAVVLRGELTSTRMVQLY
jgi:hypothetical protein